jgi:rhomboid protease GluP
MKINITLNTLNFLIYFNLFVFFLVYIVISIFGFSAIESDFESRMLIGILEVRRGDINNFGTLVTSIFLHINFLHIVVNMYSLYKVGEVVYSLYDGKKLFIAYVLGGLGGSLLTSVYYVLINGSVSTIGASGAIFALVGLLLGGSIRKYKYGYGLPIDPKNILLVTLLSLSIGLMPNLSINNLAHIGGLLTGIILGLFFKHSLGSYESMMERRIVNFLFNLSIGLVVLSYFYVFLDVIIA